jgi:hypothetical protein
VLAIRHWLGLVTGVLVTGDSLSFQPPGNLLLDTQSFANWGVLFPAGLCVSMNLFVGPLCLSRREVGVQRFAAARLYNYSNPLQLSNLGQ